MKQNYYLIGSKYGSEDIFPYMVERSAVSVGFAWDYDLSEWLGKPETEIIDYLSQIGENSNSYSALKLFLNLKEGDLIANKEHGVSNREKTTIRYLWICRCENN